MLDRTQGLLDASFCLLWLYPVHSFACRLAPSTTKLSRSATTSWPPYRCPFTCLLSPDLVCERRPSQHIVDADRVFTPPLAPLPGSGLYRQPPGDKAAGLVRLEHDWEGLAVYDLFMPLVLRNPT